MERTNVHVSAGADLPISTAARGWQRVVRCDQLLLLRVRRLEKPLATRIMKAITHLGDASSWMFVGLLLLGAGGEAALMAQHLAVAAVLATLVVQPLKRTCVRPRPSARLAGFLPLADNPDAFSFPSGHTAAAFAVAVALTGASTLLGPLLFCFAGCVAISRVYLGAHYPLDVACGAVIGLVAGLAAPWILAALGAGGAT